MRASESPLGMIGPSWEDLERARVRLRAKARSDSQAGAELEEDNGAPWSWTRRGEEAKRWALDYKEDLTALARAGDGAALTDFIKRVPLCSGQRMALDPSWLGIPELFKQAHPRALQALLGDWMRPEMLKALGDGAAMRRCAERWTGCLGVSMARAGGSSETREACMELMEMGAGPQGFVSAETLNEQLGAMLAHGGGAPEDFEAFLGRAHGLVASGAPSHMATFASRVRSRFEKPMEELEAGEREGERSEASNKESLLGCAKVFVAWCAKIDLGHSDYPVRPRVLGLFQPFALRPELSEDVARLWLKYAGLDGRGIRLDGSEAWAAEGCGLPIVERGGSLLGRVGWEGRLVGPVDQALLHGRIDAARALIKAGVAWSAEDFADLCGRLARCESARTERGLGVGDMCQRGLALGDKLALELETGEAPWNGRDAVLRRRGPRRC